METRTGKTLLWIGVFFILSPVFWQIKQIAATENLAIKPIWKISVFEVVDINRIRGLHQSGPEKIVGRIAWNRPMASGEKFLKNVSLFLDPNFYFFGEHPRERTEVIAREKLLNVDLFLLLWGLWLLAKEKRIDKWLKLFFGAVFVSAGLGLNNNLASLPMVILLLWPIAIAFEKMLLKKSAWLSGYLLIKMFEIIFWLINYA